MDIREVPASQLRWEVVWQDLLVLEPRMSSAAVASGAPDRLVVHRKGRPGYEEAVPSAHALTHELRIFPNTPQVPPRRPPCPKRRLVCMAHTLLESHSAPHQRPDVSTSGEAQVILRLLAVVPCLSCWMTPRAPDWDDELPTGTSTAGALEPLSHILPCWHDTMQVSAPPIGCPPLLCCPAPSPRPAVGWGAYQPADTLQRCHHIRTVSQYRRHMTSRP